ncbi:Cyclic nucleotide-binding protein [Pseudocohnilembus persalinus]|uniref:Cyclic nucleotide-binding protein n=1 Tax=Pseudocohnilembus persalinus TaxID=266149 RepID=A0A0V0QZ67_PSEPJ|nr:Cyclic nucleotide-binding protein [Pseudocohnilembus persalinus]|eukprot:KRX07554.1 Cyclic nucleotide-binding protein [Pseudocohnilembus persalinus]
MFNFLQEIGDIAIFVNNVGVLAIKEFLKMERQEIQDQVDINCGSVCIMLKFQLEYVKNNRQRKILIMNLSSVSGDCILGYYQVYCGSKAFVSRFLENVIYEIEEEKKNKKNKNYDNLEIFVLKPGFIKTQMTGGKMGINTKQAVLGSFNMLGKKKITDGHWIHQIQNKITRMFVFESKYMNLEDCNFGVLSKQAFNKVLYQAEIEKLEKQVEQIKLIPSLKYTSTLLLEDLLKNSETCQFLKGNYLFKEGEKVSYCYIVIEGEIQLEKIAHDNLEQEQLSQDPNQQIQVEQRQQDQKEDNQNNIYQLRLYILGKNEFVGDEDIINKKKVRQYSARVISQSAKLLKVKKEILVIQIYNENLGKKYLEQQQLENDKNNEALGYNNQNQILEFCKNQREQEKEKKINQLDFQKLKHQEIFKDQIYLDRFQSLLKNESILKQNEIQKQIEQDKQNKLFQLQQQQKELIEKSKKKQQQQIQKSKEENLQMFYNKNQDNLEIQQQQELKIIQLKNEEKIKNNQPYQQCQQKNDKRKNIFAIHIKNKFAQKQQLNKNGSEINNNNLNEIYFHQGQDLLQKQHYNEFISRQDQDFRDKNVHPLRFPNSEEYLKKMKEKNSPTFDISIKNKMVDRVQMFKITDSPKKISKAHHNIDKVNMIPSVLIFNRYLKDLLKQKGLASSSYSDWTQESGSSIKNQISIQTDNEGDKFIKIEKTEDQKISFSNDEGIWIKFGKSQPKHLRFKFSSTNKETEDTNLRLKNDSDDLTVVSFRCGNAGFIRVNDQQMVGFYNSTVSEKSTTDVKWTQCDVLLDWDKQSVDIFIDETYKGQGEFYHSEVSKVDKLQMYNLKPGTVSYFKNLEVCDEKCENFNWGKNMKSSIILISILSFAILM